MSGPPVAPAGMGFNVDTAVTIPNISPAQLLNPITPNECPGSQDVNTNGNIPVPGAQNVNTSKDIPMPSHTSRDVPMSRASKPAMGTGNPNTMIHGNSSFQPANHAHGPQGLSHPQKATMGREFIGMPGVSGASHIQPTDHTHTPQSPSRPEKTTIIRGFGMLGAKDVYHVHPPVNVNATQSPTHPQKITMGTDFSGLSSANNASHVESSVQTNIPRSSSGLQNATNEKSNEVPVAMNSIPQNSSRPQNATMDKRNDTIVANNGTSQGPSRSQKTTVHKSHDTSITNNGTARGPSRPQKTKMNQDIDMSDINSNTLQGPPRLQQTSIGTDTNMSGVNNDTPRRQAVQSANASRAHSFPTNAVIPQANGNVGDIHGLTNVTSVFGTSSMVATLQSGTAVMALPQPQPVATAHQTAASQLSESDAGSVDISEQSSSNDPSVFPKFDDGDVMITSPTGRTWKLHSMVLATASPRFKEIFNTSAPIHISKKQREEGATVRWRLVMKFEEEAHDLDPNSLQFKNFRAIELSDKKSVQVANINGLGTAEGYNKLYDNLFRCIYNLEPTFTDDVVTGEGRQFILDASTLLQAAVFLSAVSSVRVIIEAHLLRLNQLLWHHISNRPEGWVHLAARLESPLMFREAMLHIVGKFNLPGGVDIELLQRPAFGHSGQRIWSLIKLKVAHLRALKLNTERHLLEYYPARMVHKEDQETYVPGRATYANDIYLWMALTLFRQYVGSSYAMNFHHRAPDGGLAFYRTLGTAETTYIRRNTLEAFHRSFDMSSKGKACLQQAIEAIKTDIKPCLAKLLVDRSQATRSPNAPRLQHLTCTNITDEELPWYVPPPPPAAADDADMNNAV